MTDGQPPEDVSAANERSFQELIRTIQRSEGQFVLILARCNYEKERSRWVQRLQSDRCTLDIRQISLEKSVETLYTTIVDALKGEPPPPAVMVLGLESVSNLEPVLTSTNQVREEFRKNFAFPLILWVNDRVLRQMIRLVPDFKSWSTSFYFTLDTHALIDLLQQSVNDVENGSQSLPNAALLSGQELELASADLTSRGYKLPPQLEASVKFFLGRNAYARDRIEEALRHYQNSLAIFKQIERQEDFCSQNSTSNVLELGVLLFQIGLCYLRQSQLQQLEEKSLQEAKSYFQQCVEMFEQQQRLNLVAKFISQLGEVLQRLEEWDELEALAQKSLNLHQLYGTSVQLAQDYGFLATVALSRSQWQEARHAARQALQILDNQTDKAPRSHRSLYLLLLARAQQHLGQLRYAVKCLEEAQQQCFPQDDPQLYIQVLTELRSLYFKQRKYLKAFDVKQTQRSIEQQFGFRAFIGAGSLKPQQRAKSGSDSQQQQESVVQEIAASGREQDVKKLRDRITSHQSRLTAIYGQSGVGKSSIVNAGLVPALQQKTIATREVLPVVLQNYTNWVANLGKALAIALEEVKQLCLLATLNSENGILEQLRNNVDIERNLLTVLIFDQFEDFFFSRAESNQKKRFFEFLANCLNIPFVYVILSIREDYLHYLLEGNRLQQMELINNDILSKNILYYLGNFSRKDAEEIVHRLTERTQFHPERPLVEQLVKDLAGELNEVRPIELQIVGTQLQERKIHSLEQYQSLGNNPKEQLVQSYLDEVVKDCGTENQESANLILYLLTDEKNKRPLKTIDDLKRDIKALPFPESLAAEVNGLNLVLEIFVRSGLVLLLPENPTQRYQLVHDYLAELIRKEPKWKNLFDEEKQRRKQAEKKLERAKGELKQAEEKLEHAKEGLKQAEEKRQQANRQAKQAKQILIGSVVITAALLVWAWITTGELQIYIKGKLLEKEGFIISQDSKFRGNEEPFIKAMLAGKELQEIVDKDRKLKDYPAISPIFALQQTLNFIQKYEQRLPDKPPDDERLVWSISFSPHRHALAYVSADDKVHLWDLQGKEKEIVLDPKPKQDFLSVSFSSDGNLLAASTSDGYIRLWQRQGSQIDSFKEIKPLQVGENISTISFSPSNRRQLATISGNGTAKLWNLENHREVVSFGNEISCISFSGDGQKLATGLKNGTVRLWDLQGNKLKEFSAHRQQGEPQPVRSVSFAPNGQQLATGLEDGTVRLWDLQGKQQGTDLKGHTKQVQSISFNPNEQQLATASDDGTTRLWDTKGIQLAIFEGREGATLFNSFIRDGQGLATASSQGTVRYWKLKPQNKHQIVSKPDTEVRSVSFNRNGLLAIGSKDGYVRLWQCQDKQGCKPKDAIKTSGKVVYSVSFSPNGQQIATGLEDGTASIWDLKSHKNNSFKHGSDPVRNVSFNPKEQQIATASEDGTIKLWQLNDNKRPQIVIKPYGKEVFSVSFSSDGKQLASASTDGFVRLWDLQDCLKQSQLCSSPEQKLAGGRGIAFGVSFSPDNQDVAIAYENGTAELWNSESENRQPRRQPNAVFAGHTDWVTSVSFSPDGQKLATASRDGTVRVWTLDGKPLAIFQGHSNRIDSVSFNPDGKWLATASRDKTARLWHVQDLPELLKAGCAQLPNSSLKTYFQQNYKNARPKLLSFCKNWE